jgi:cytochrome c
MRIATAIGAALTLSLLGCKPAMRMDSQSLVTGTIMRHYGCPACHAIPGIPGANSTVGPPLEHLRRRSYFAGTLTNTQQNLSFWIRHPQQIHPGSAMPEMHVTQSDADQMAAYLETLN